MSEPTAPHQSVAAQTTTLIRGGVRGPSFAGLREVVKYRGVLFALVRRTITTRYRQSIGGIIWILAGPLSSAATYSVFLGNIGGVKGDKGTDYLLFALVGTVVWGIFLRGGIGGMNTLVTNATFVKKVYFPRVMLPISSVGQSLADLVPATIMMFAVALILGESPTFGWVLLVVPFFIVTAFSVAFAMVVSAINVYVRDLSYAAPIITQVGMLASAVVYKVSAIPERFRTLYSIANPIVGAIDNARGLVYRGEGLDPVTTIGGLIWVAILLLGSFMVFSVLERDAADRI